LHRAAPAGTFISMRRHAKFAIQKRFGEFQGSPGDLPAIASAPEVK
jgi:hypothetical protein